MLITGRLEIERAAMSHSMSYTRFLTANPAHFKGSEPARAASWYQDASVQQRLKRSSAAFEQGTELRFICRLKGAQPIVVEFAFTNIMRGPFQACFLGFRVGKRFEGQGYMTEALHAGISYVFQTTGLHRIMAAYRPTNYRSGRTLHRLGFRVEGYAPRYLLLDGAWRDHVLTALVSDDWQQGAPAGVQPA